MFVEFYTEKFRNRPQVAADLQIVDITECLFLLRHKVSTLHNLWTACLSYLLRRVPVIGLLLGNFNFKMNKRARLIINIRKKQAFRIHIWNPLSVLKVASEIIYNYLIQKQFLYWKSSNDKTYVMSKIFTVVAVWLLLVSGLLVLMWIDYKILRSKTCAVMSIILKFEILKRWTLLKQGSLMAELSGLVNLSPVLKEIPLCCAQLLNRCSALLPIYNCWQ